jgi:hypothetical protein
VEIIDVFDALIFGVALGVFTGKFVHPVRRRHRIGGEHTKPTF